MKKSSDLQSLVGALSERAQALGLTDTEWARRAAVRKETLSRLRSRESCDFVTLQMLAEAVGARVGVLDERLPNATASGLFPARLGRDYEERLVELCASGDLDTQRWLEYGPRFFMAGLAVMMASAPGADRSRLLRLAEVLHPGMSEPAVFARWLEQGPLRASRFLPMVQSEKPHAS